MATIRSSRSEADTRIPVSTGRVSSREADPRHLLGRRNERVGRHLTAVSGSGSGNGGKSSLRSVRM